MIRYMTADGEEVVLTSSDALVQAVRSGALGPTTLVFDESERRWKAAERWPGFQASQSLIRAVESPGRPSEPAGPAAPGPDRAEGDARPAAFAPPAPPAPRHGTRGYLYVGFAYLGAALFGLSGLVLSVVAIYDGEPGVALTLFLLLGGLAALSYFLGRAVWRSSPTGRVIALVLAYVGLAGAVVGLFAPEDGASALGALFSIPFNIAFIHYFHTRRSDFGSPHHQTIGLPEDVIASGPAPYAAPADGTLTVVCPACSNRESVPYGERHDRTRYHRFEASEGFFSGSWRFLCRTCHHEFAFDPVRAPLEPRSGISG
jgi:hypothetical protein